MFASEPMSINILNQDHQPSRTSHVCPSVGTEKSWKL